MATGDIRKKKKSTLAFSSLGTVAEIHMSQSGVKKLENKCPVWCTECSLRVDSHCLVYDIWQIPVTLRVEG